MNFSPNPNHYFFLKKKPISNPKFNYLSGPQAHIKSSTLPLAKPTNSNNSSISSPSRHPLHLPPISLVFSKNPPPPSPPPSKWISLTSCFDYWDTHSWRTMFCSWWRTFLLPSTAMAKSSSPSSSNPSSPSYSPTFFSGSYYCICFLIVIGSNSRVNWVLRR